MTALIILFISLVVSSVGVGFIRRVAIAQQMIDIPNERSSHDRPTPRGGGLSIVLITLVGALILGLSGVLEWAVVGAVLTGGLVAFIGYVDDRGDLSPMKRALVHVVAACLGVILLGGMPPLDLGFTTLAWGWFGHAVAVFGVVWMVNLYNFMDGIDGLAGSEAVFIFGVGGLILTAAGINGLFLLCMLIVGACGGFLVWNWPPAKIFMGDVASGFLGYLIAIIAIAAANQEFSLWIWLILVGVFIVDATVTLLRRMLRGDKWYRPHRSHAYQHLTQLWGSHLRVTVAISALNLLWLAPLALVVQISGDWLLLSVFVALAPLIGLALMMGAGRETIGRQTRSIQQRY